MLSIDVQAVVESEGTEARKEGLHRFVRERRLRLAPESPVLGGSPRYPTRIGKFVTQEELAEHLGISRGWYSRFEVGAIPMLPARKRNVAPRRCVLSSLNQPRKSTAPRTTTATRIAPAPTSLTVTMRGGLGPLSAWTRALMMLPTDIGPTQKEPVW